MIESLQRAVAAMAREDQEREIASKSVWFKQKSPSYLLGQRRKLVTRMPRCPACECFAVARDRAIGKLLDLIQDQRHRRTLELGHGLCLKHFADAYLIAPKGAVRDALTAMHMAKLSAAKQELAPLFALSRASNTDRLPGPVAAVWRRAIYHVSPAV